MAGAIPNSGFRRYVRELRQLTRVAVSSGGLPHSGIDLAHAHLDERAGRELRSAVALEDLRRIGAFFTGEALARQLLARAQAPSNWCHVVDPACGCGDLLLAAARRLEVTDSLRETLERWGTVLHGVDREPEFVETARHRLTLLALVRGARPARGERLDPSSLLPGLTVADGRRSTCLKRADLVLLNPPYGQVPAPEETRWGTGRVTEAALWIDGALESMPDGARLLAIVPDVLRSGSRYSRWREEVRARSQSIDLHTIGQFDALTDVDVFLFDAVSGEISQRTHHSADPQNTTRRVAATLGDVCRVMVGAVVDRRDPHVGPKVPYLTTAELPQEGEFAPTRTRRFGKRRFVAPFVVVRRTSRPTLDAARLRPVVVHSPEAVAVENHLLVLQPSETSGVEACRRLASALQRPAVTAWLNERIRLRHMTVGAMREIPLDCLRRESSWVSSAGGSLGP